MKKLAKSPRKTPKHDSKMKAYFIYAYIILYCDFGIS